MTPGAAKSVALVACLLAPISASAQSKQSISMQGSALYARLFGNAYLGIQDGIGGELQVRYTPSAFSFGVGIQRTDHAVAGFSRKLRLAGVFFEPRYVLSIIQSQNVAPYVSARVSLLQQYIREPTGTGTSTGLTANLGGGLMVRVTDRINGEAGATFGYTRFGDYEVRLSTGQRNRAAQGSGSNVVVRVGFAIGLFR
jgi:hypothetical protein